MVFCLSLSTLIWIWTIHALRKYTKNSDELLPNKWIFTLLAVRSVDRRCAH